MRGQDCSCVYKNKTHTNVQSPGWSLLSTAQQAVTKDLRKKVGEMKEESSETKNRFGFDDGEICLEAKDPQGAIPDFLKETKIGHVALPDG